MTSLQTNTLSSPPLGETQRGLLYLFIIVMAGACSSHPEVPSAVLEIRAPQEATHRFSWSALTDLPSLLGSGGILNTAGRITPPAQHKGVPLDDLLAFVSGMSDEQGLQVVASDDYVVTLSSSQVLRGDVVTFDPESGQPNTLSTPPRAVLAYELEGERIAEQDGGPLRVTFLTTEEAQVTEGHLWVKSVIRLEVVAAEPEWSLRLDGARAEEISRTFFESGSAPGCHEARWIDAEGRSWSGIPLWLLVGWVDDDNVHSVGAFNRELAASGYGVELISSSGERLTLSSDRITLDDGVIVANQVDGEPLGTSYAPLRLVGETFAPEEMLGGLEEMILHLP